MFNRKHKKSARSGDAPFCKLCGADVEIDLFGRCRLGHQSVSPAFAATAGPELLDTPAATDGVTAWLPPDSEWTPLAAVDTDREESAAAPPAGADADADARARLNDETIRFERPEPPTEPPAGEPEPHADRGATDDAASWFTGEPPTPRDAGGSDPAAASLQHDAAALWSSGEAGTAAQETGAAPDDPAGQARQRLLEAASWFSATED